VPLSAFESRERAIQPAEDARRLSFPLMLTPYVGVLPLFVYEVIEAEMRMEQHPAKLLVVAIAAVSIHAGMAVGRRGTEEIEEEMQGYEGEFQLLELGER
jgi:hypothetical protein